MVHSSRSASCGKDGRRLPAVAVRATPAPALATHPCGEQGTGLDCTLALTETHLRKYYVNTTVLLRGASGIAWASAYNPHHAWGPGGAGTCPATTARHGWPSGDAAGPGGGHQARPL